MRIRRDHELGLEGARRRIDRLRAELERQYSMASAWDGDHVVVTGSGVNGRIIVEPEYVEVEIRLGLTLMLFERQIRTGIKNAMDEHFG